MSALTERRPRVEQSEQPPHEPISGPRRFRPDIQGLRAVAVLLVILYDARVPLVRGGYVGVDVFFVISGFLITGQLVREVSHRGRVHFSEFYLKRIRRLLPPAAIVVISTMLVARRWAPPLQVTPWSWDAIYTAFYGINYRLAALGVNYQNADGQVSPFQHYWSLAVEEQYYIIWPVLITVIVLLSGRRRWLRVLPAVLVAAVVVSLFTSTQLLHTNAPLAYFSMQSRAWELGVGALLALGAGRFARLKLGPAGLLSYLGVVLIVGSAVWFTDQTAFPGLPATVPVAGAALVILAGCHPVAAGAERTLLRWRPMQGVGRVSYSWYLWHWPMVVMLPLIAPNYTFGWVRNLEAMVLALWLATLTYFLVEAATLRSAFRKLFWAAGGLVTSAAMIGAALAVVATMPTLVGTGAAESAVTTDRSADASYVQRVADQIERSSAIRAAPKNLTPDLVSASHDYPETSIHGECRTNYLVVDQGDCVSGDPAGTKTMVLVGDSQAEQWEPAFATAGSREHWKVITWAKSACPFANLSIFNPQLGRQYTECDQWRAKTMARILALKPDLVVMGQSDSVIGKAFSDQQWADATVQSAQTFTKARIPVTYMLDSVYPLHDVPQCVTQHLGDVRQCMAHGRVDWVERRHDVVAHTLSNARVPVVEPEPWQCANGQCPVIVGNILVYRDSRLMSASYSRWLAPLVQPLLAAKATVTNTVASTKATTPRRTPESTGKKTPSRPTMSADNRQVSQKRSKSKKLTIGDGQWLVGRDISAGTYRTMSASDNCYWARLADVVQSTRLQDGTGKGTLTARITAKDKAFVSISCGLWRRILK